MERRIPVCSNTPPKVIATIVIETVFIIESKPPRLNSSSTSLFPVSITNPAWSAPTDAETEPP